MIIMDQNKLAGIVNNNGNPLAFYSDKYDFIFSPTRILGSNEYISIITSDGFLHGTIYDGKKISIYVGQEIDHFSIDRDISIPVPMYMKSVSFINVDINTFKSISFHGGTLNELCGNERIVSTYDKDDNVSIERITQRKTYEFTTKNGKCSVSIGISPRDTWGRNKSEFKNEGFLTLTFENEQTINSVLNHYRNVKRLIAIMTNRVENHFDEIILSPDTSISNWHLKQVEVFIYDNEVPITRRWSAIRFPDIDDSVASILQLFYNSKENKPSFSLGFIPMNDDDFGNITDDKIRAICAALECEITFHKEIENAQEDGLSELAKRVKAVIKEYREETCEKPNLTDGTYDLINGSISHWSMSAYEKTIMLYEKYKEAIEKYNHGNRKLQGSDIHDFIKYRNSITHGSYQIMNNRIRWTALNMEVLVICSLLNRSGVPKEKLIELCEMDIGR